MFFVNILLLTRKTMQRNKSDYTINYKIMYVTCFSDRKKLSKLTLFTVNSTHVTKTLLELCLQNNVLWDMNIVFSFTTGVKMLTDY